jgi:hypothetical protein
MIEYTPLAHADDEYDEVNDGFFNEKDGIDEERKILFFVKGQDDMLHEYTTHDGYSSEDYVLMNESTYQMIRKTSFVHDHEVLRLERSCGNYVFQNVGAVKTTGGFYFISKFNLNDLESYIHVNDYYKVVKE